MRRLPLQFLALIVLALLWPNSAYPKEIDPGWGVILNVNESMIETPVPESNRLSGSICELEDKSDPDFKVTVFALKTFRRTMDEITLESFAESSLETFRKSLGQSVKVLEKRKQTLPKPGYQVTLQAQEPNLFIVLFDTVSYGFEYIIAFSFPENTKERLAKVQTILEGIRLRIALSFLGGIRETGFSLLDVEGVRIPYPKGWKVFSAENIEELKKMEVTDRFYSKLLSSGEGAYVFKSKYENEQAFTMTVGLIKRTIDLEQSYPGTRELLNSFFARDYGKNYIDKSQGKIWVKDRAYYHLSFQTLVPENHSTLYQFLFTHRGLTYMVKFKTPTLLFETFRSTFDRIISEIQY